MKKIILIIFIFTVLIHTNIYASDEMIESQLDIININEFSKQLKDFDNEYTQSFNLKETIIKLIKGETKFDLGEIANNVIKTILVEAYSQIHIMRNLIFIACICALAKNLSSSFQSKAVGELAFYVSYIVMVIMLIQSFRLAITLTYETITSISSLLDIFLPVLTTLLITSGGYVSASTFHPITIFAGEVITKIIKNVAIPFIFCSSILEIVNCISSKDILTNLSELIKKCIGWGLKGISIMFTASLTLNKLTAPAIETVINKTAKVAVSAIPVVGEVMAGTVDTVASWTGLIKNGTTLAIIIFLILICAIPVLKLISLILIYKFTAAIIQPIADSRIVKCIDSISAACQLLLGSLFCVMVIFIFISMAGISITQG